MWFYFVKFFFKWLVCIYLCVFMCVCLSAVTRMWRSEDSLGKWGSFYHVPSRNLTQVSDRKHLYLLSRFPCPLLCFYPHTGSSPGPPVHFWMVLFLPSASRSALLSQEFHHLPYPFRIPSLSLILQPPSGFTHSGFWSLSFGEIQLVFFSFFFFLLYLRMSYLRIPFQIRASENSWLSFIVKVSLF